MAYPEFTAKTAGGTRECLRHWCSVASSDGLSMSSSGPEAATNQACPSLRLGSDTLNCRQVNMMGRSLINSCLRCSSVISVSGKHPFREKISPPWSSLETCFYMHGCHLTDGDKAALAGLSEYTKRASVTSTTRTSWFCPRNFSALTSTGLLKHINFAVVHPYRGLLHSIQLYVVPFTLHTSGIHSCFTEDITLY